MIYPGDKGTFFLDKSFYQDQMDYELEFESESLEEGALIFQNFLKLHGIKVRKAKQKSRTYAGHIQIRRHIISS